MSDLLTPKRLIIKIILSASALAVVMLVCSFVGTQKVSLNDVLAGWGGEPGQNIGYDIFIRVRVPRVILAAIVGAALAASGVVLQAILRNPLAEPYILGISSGAAMGVMTAVLFGAGLAAKINLGTFWGNSPMAVMAFLFAFGTVWLVWLIGRLAGGSAVTNLLLAGVVVNAFFSAVIMLLTSIIDSQQLRTTTFWLMGNITEKSFSTLLPSAIFIIAGVFGLFTLSQKLNVLTFGTNDAQTLGVNPRAVALAGFALASFITAAAVGLSGLVGFVGLVVPHSVRLVFGPDHRQLLPASALLGAAFVIICDTIARTIISPAQLPVGVITAIIGGPVFLILLAGYSKKTRSLR